jgi:cytochrome c553
MADHDHLDLRQLSTWQRLGLASVVVLGALLLSGVIFILSGVYNIGASRDHWSVTNLLLTIVRDRSISVAAGSIKAPPLNDPDLYRLGAQHVALQCTACHSTPGEPLNPVYSNMLPSPPDLTGTIHDYSASEAFWIVNHGLKYTGMPAWPASDRPDEVWSVVAFLDRLGRLGPEIYAAETQAPGGEFGQCVQCHGGQTTAPVSDLVPRLNGLPETQLIQSLQYYRSGLRSSGFMVPLAHDMSDAEIAAVAEYFADLPPLPPPEVVDTKAIERGRLIAQNGVPERDVPACASCHGSGRPGMPRLAGQSARYMDNQLLLWQNDPGFRTASPLAEIMAVVGRRLTPEQAADVSAYYASLLPESTQ